MGPETPAPSGPCTDHQPSPEELHEINRGTAAIAKKSLYLMRK